MWYGFVLSNRACVSVLMREFACTVSVLILKLGILEVKVFAWLDFSEMCIGKDKDFLWKKTAFSSVNTLTSRCKFLSATL